MALLDPTVWDAQELAVHYRSAAPFPHVVIDGLLSDEALAQIVGAVSREPHWPNRGEIYDMMGSVEPPLQPELLAFRDALATPTALAVIGAMTGRRLGRVEMRSYVYLPGHYLLPHLDDQRGLERQLAYAFYLPAPSVGTLVGGELELFRCRRGTDDLVDIEAALRIEPRPNRLVLFEVSPISLHQVCEVTQGARLSLAGWFY